MLLFFVVFGFVCLYLFFDPQYSHYVGALNLFVWLFAAQAVSGKYRSTVQHLHGLLFSSILCLLPGHLVELLIL